METSIVCGKDGLVNAIVSVNGKIVPNREVTQITDGEVFTKTGSLFGKVKVTFLNGDVAIPDDVRTQMYPS